MKENPGLLSMPQSPWGPTLDSLQFVDASHNGDTKPFPVSRFASPVLSRENYAFLRPAACGLASTALDKTDLHRCVCTSLPPLGTPGPLQHHSPSTSSPSLFSIQYLPYGSHASNLSYEHIPSLPSLL